MEELKMVKCKRCAYEWIARVANPKTCSKCKSRLWNVEVKKEELVLNG
jgi:predicted Zn-ribbon and HTH transcriptional regulator